jgi:hypothetical protein
MKRTDFLLRFVVIVGALVLLWGVIVVALMFKYRHPS